MRFISRDVELPLKTKYTLQSYIYVIFLKPMSGKR